MKHTAWPDTERSLTDRIAFYESGAEHYLKYGELAMADWSTGKAREAADQLAVLKGKRESGDGE